MISKRLTHARLRPHATLITAAWIVYWVILCGLTHWPKLPRIPIQLSARGIVAHFIAFALLAAGCVLSRRARLPQMTNAWLYTWLVVFAAYAALDELLQPLSNRQCDVADWAADVAGAAVVLFAARSWSPVATMTRQ